MGSALCSSQRDTSPNRNKRDNSIKTTRRNSTKRRYRLFSRIPRHNNNNDSHHGQTNVESNDNSLHGKFHFLFAFYGF